MVHKLTEEEETENIKGETTEILIGAYLSEKGYFHTTPELKQKVLDELFDRLTRFESCEQAIINRRLHYERWLSERGYFGAWDSIEELTKGKDNTYQFGIASGIYDVCTALLRMTEKKEKQE